ncbi:hypothetical protein [Acetivibrio clariflavus]|uniref:Uncharacterized protein n=1 Tax=Acetivibrio clariflavus (strain DSM 19732 / NBRC 101661 / EBR45) TaxID=720554 RepID=G8LTI0_ACECE|nr:hypothetical protein [Acetivibrio clariflavus]AEV69475.1 hypothetical protein Clocl_2928 [Acetivibrio clariflavus DSM 19732]
MTITKECLLEEISESSEFSKIFKNCSRELQDLLIKLVIEISKYSCNKEGYVKNMKETSIRFQKTIFNWEKESELLYVNFTSIT